MTTAPKNSKTLEDVLLYPEDIDNEKLAQVKCTKCGCINVFWKDLPDYERFMAKGYGLRQMYRCINLNCPCHRGNGKLPRILIRDVSLDVAFGVGNNG